MKIWSYWFCIILTGLLSIDAGGMTIVPLRPSGPPAGDPPGTGLPPIATDPNALKIEGKGWFVLRDASNGRHYFTRHGAFHWDGASKYSSDQGLRLQGYSNGTGNSIGDLTLVLPPESLSSASVSGYSFAPDGTLQVKLSDDRQVVCGQLLLQDFERPEKLIRVGYQVYASTPEAEPSQALKAPGTAGLGSIIAGQFDSTPESVLLSLRRSDLFSHPLAAGFLTGTGVPSDLGIQGPGAFLLRDPVTSERFATRTGLFLPDGDGYLISYDGLRVQGLTNCGSSDVGDLRIHGSEANAMASESVLSLNNYSIAGDGTIKVSLGGNMEQCRGRIITYTFQHPERLQEVAYKRLTHVAQAEPQPLGSVGGPYENGIRQGYLELDHVSEELLAIRGKLNFFLQGLLWLTGTKSDLAITGNGFFLVRDPNYGTFYALRTGAFRLEATGYLVTERGLRLQGFSDAALTTRGDIQINGEGRRRISSDSTYVTDYDIDLDGRINVHLSDNTTFLRGQITLQAFGEPYRLEPVGAHTYTNLEAARPILVSEPAGTGGFGEIVSGAFEMNSPPLQLSLPARHGLRLRIEGEPNSFWSVETSTDMINWTEFDFFARPDEAIEISVPDGGPYQQRFYRVLQSP